MADRQSHQSMDCAADGEEGSSTDPLEIGSEEEAVPKAEKRAKLDEIFVRAQGSTEQGPAATSEPTYVPTRKLPASVHEPTIAASPPRFMNLEDIMKMANGVSDMSLAHELAVNGEFKLEHAEPPPDSLEGQVREIVHRAFWDMLEEKLRTDPSDHLYLVKLIQDVKQSLLEVLPSPHGRVRASIEEVLDLTLIEQIAERGELDMHHYANYIVGVMASLCAPVRDDRIQAMKQITDIVPLFKEICEVLSLMKLDMMNFAITRLRPLIREHSVEYERNKFNSLLVTQRENGVDGLEFTRDWLARNYNKFDHTATTTTSTTIKTTTAMGKSSTTTSQGTAVDNPSSEQTAATAASSAVAASSAAAVVTSAASSAAASSAAAAGTAGGGTVEPGPPPVSLWRSGTDDVMSGGVSTRSAINSAYMELLDWDDSRLYPETLVVDVKRVMELRDRVLRVTLVASVLAVTYSIVGTLVQGVEDFKKTLADRVTILIKDYNTQSTDLSELMSVVSEQVVELSNHCLTSHGFKVMTTDRINQLKAQLVALTQPTNHVTGLMKSRLLSFISSILASPATRRDVRIPLGFGSVENELTSIVEAFMRLVAYNYAVFSTHYTDIINKLEAEEEAKQQQQLKAAGQDVRMETGTH